jgi:DNA-binding NarL/FixJ family response regulator
MKGTSAEVYPYRGRFCSHSRMIRQALEQHGGWEVSGEAADGRQAIDEAQRLKPDLVVLDLSMLLNGLEAARVLKPLLRSGALADVHEL